MTEVPGRAWAPPEPMHLVDALRMVKMPEVIAKTRQLSIVALQIQSCVSFHDIGPGFFPSMNHEVNSWNKKHGDDDGER
jgi:hypothetical protein